MSTARIGATVHRRLPLRSCSGPTSVCAVKACCRLCATATCCTSCPGRGRPAATDAERWLVVESPAMDGSFWVKRVIGLPGEFVTAIDSGRIVIDDVPLTEPYLHRRDRPARRDLIVAMRRPRVFPAGRQPGRQQRQPSLRTHTVADDNRPRVAPLAAASLRTDGA